MTKPSSHLDAEMTAEQRRMIREVADVLTEEVNEDPMFQERLDRMLELAGIKLKSVMVGHGDSMSLYQIERCELVRLLMVPTAAARVMGRAE